MLGENNVILNIGTLKLNSRRPVRKTSGILCEKSKYLHFSSLLFGWSKKKLFFWSITFLKITKMMRSNTLMNWMFLKIWWLKIMCWYKAEEQIQTLSIWTPCNEGSVMIPFLKEIERVNNIGHEIASTTKRYRKLVVNYPFRMNYATGAYYCSGMLLSICLSKLNAHWLKMLKVSMIKVSQI